MQEITIFLPTKKILAAGYPIPEVGLGAGPHLATGAALFLHPLLTTEIAHRLTSHCSGNTEKRKALCVAAGQPTEMGGGETIHTRGG